MEPKVRGSLSLTGPCAFLDSLGCQGGGPFLMSTHGTFLDGAEVLTADQRRGVAVPTQRSPPLLLRGFAPQTQARELLTQRLQPNPRGP